MGDDWFKDEKGLVRLNPGRCGDGYPTVRLSVVSTPGFDPNSFSNRLSVRDWQRMNTTRTRKPLHIGFICPRFDL